MMSSAVSPMLFSAASAVVSPEPRMRVFFLSMPRSANALPSAAGCAPPGMKMKIDSGREVLRALHEGGEVRVRDREAHRADDGAAGGLERALERGLGVVARAVVGDHGVVLLDAALGRGPGAEGLHHLRQGHRGADHVGRLGDHHRGGGVHHHHELLRLGRDVAAGHGVGREHVAREDVDVVAHHQLLRQALGDVGCRAADVLGDELDLAPGDGVAVHLHVGLGAVQHLAGGVGELARTG